MFFLTGCATHDIATSQQQTEIPISLVTVSKASNDESLSLSARSLVDQDGQSPVMVRWGGTITRLSNTASQQTEIEFVSRPLNRRGRPLHNDQSDGRFIAVFNEFLDPEIIAVGRDMTVTGALSRRQSGKVGDADYIFPVVDVGSYMYWKKRVSQPVNHFPHWNSRYRHDRRSNDLWIHDPFWPHWHLFHRKPTR
ncbi:MAG: Slp family lipoprotein [Granulosicoccus sp.]